MSHDTALARLRDATRERHERLEHRFNAVQQLTSSEGRRALILRYHDLHSTAEQSLHDWLPYVAGLDFHARKRTPVILDSLRELGLEPGRPRFGGCAVSSRAEALGVLYVLEGSSLGGRLILREIVKAGADTQGLGFLDPYGSETGARWRDFLAILEREVAGDAAAADAAAAGAVKAFTFAEACLCGEPVHA